MSYRKKKSSPHGRAQVDSRQTMLTCMNDDLESTEELLSTGELWGQDALQFAALTFYPNLPEEARQKHHIENPIEEMRPEMLRPDDY